MLSKLGITGAVIERIARKSGYTLRLKPTMTLADTPLSLSDTKIRRLVNNLRKFMKGERPAASLEKTEVVGAKNVRGVVTLLIDKIRKESVDSSEADQLISDSQQVAS